MYLWKHSFVPRFSLRGKHVIELTHICPSSSHPIFLRPSTGEMRNPNRKRPPNCKLLLYLHPTVVPVYHDIPEIPEMTRTWRIIPLRKWLIVLVFSSKWPPKNHRRMILKAAVPGASILAQHLRATVAAQVFFFSQHGEIFEQFILGQTATTGKGRLW